MKMRAIAISLAVLFSAPAMAVDVGDLVVSLCDYAKQDDRSNMRKKLKDANIRLRNIYDGVVCTDGSLLRTAASAKAMEAAEYISSQIGKKNLEAPEADGKTILQWSQEQVASGNAGMQPFVDFFNEKIN